MYMCVYIYVYIYIYMCVCVCVCMQAYIRMLLSTFARTAHILYISGQYTDNLLIWTWQFTELHLAEFIFKSQCLQ